MAAAQYSVAHVSEIVTPRKAEPGKAPWRAVRRHFGIGSFGIAAYEAQAAGDVLVGDHTEVDTRHEELFFVAAGRAAIRVGGETVDAPVGTFVCCPRPEGRARGDRAGARHDARRRRRRARQGLRGLRVGAAVPRR